MDRYSLCFNPRCGTHCLNADFGCHLDAAALVIPAITARLLTDSFNRMIIFSALIGALTGFTGMYLSYYVDVASGTSIVLVQALIFGLVLTITSLQKQAAR